MADLADLEKRLGVSFCDYSLLNRALVHSSFVNENPGTAPESNERLEFLGDAVLGLIMAEKLFQDFPRSQEGEMTRLRSILVRRETLAAVARNIKLGDYLFLGKGEEASGGRRKPLNLSGALEALIAAVYLDQGLDKTRECILGLFDSELTRVLESSITDYKSRLQEVVQARYQMTPTYQLVGSKGSDHDRVFTVEVRVNGNTLGSGVGKSKKIAETAAAKSALDSIS